MPSTRLALALAMVLFAPMAAHAQQLSAEATVAVTVRVRPSISIRAVTPAPTRGDSETGMTVPTVVAVESNLPYRVAVRLAPTEALRERSNAARVLVRAADGTFEELRAGGAVTAVVSAVPGRREHEVVCRLETSAAEVLDAGRCALVYELSAEYHDTLLRSTATLTDHGLRSTD